MRPSKIIGLMAGIGITALVIVLLYSGHDGQDKEVDIVTKIETELVTDLSIAKNASASGSNTKKEMLALKGIKPTQGGMSDEEVKQAISARMSEPLTGKRFEPKTPESKRAPN